jgi:hypothetical protein
MLLAVLATVLTAFAAVFATVFAVLPIVLLRVFDWLEFMLVLGALLPVSPQAIIRQARPADIDTRASFFIVFLLRLK